MRTVKIITTVCWVITALVLAGLALWFLTGSLFGIRLNGTNSGFSFGIGFNGLESLTGPYEEAGTYSIPSNDVKSLDADWVSGAITIVPYDGADIKLIEYAQRELQDNEKVSFEISGSTLKINYLEKQNWVLLVNKKLEIFMPIDLCENINSLTVDSASADIRVDNIASSDINLESVSGAITLSNTITGRLSSDSASGSVNFTTVSADNIRANTVSGDIRMTDCVAKTVKCDATSGTVRLSGSFEEASINTISGNSILDNAYSNSSINADSTSGDIELSGSFHSVDVDTMSGKITVVSAVVPGDFNTESISGNITVRLPNEGTVSVNHSSTSGKLSNEIPITIVNRGNAQLRFSTISGDVKILEL